MHFYYSTRSSPLQYFRFLLLLLFFSCYHLKANGCEGTTADVMKFMNSKKEGELSDDDMEKVGSLLWRWTLLTLLLSFFSYPYAAKEQKEEIHDKRNT